MTLYFDLFAAAFNSTWNWTLKSILFQVPWYLNYFWGLIIISIFIWGLEILFPWRKQQGVFRKDFWLDAFYMFFNFFLFSLAINGVYSVTQALLERIGINSTSLSLVDLSEWSFGLQIFVFFVVLDFLQWVTHIFLHRIPILWKFHQVHHSVKEMGFAAHFRYHWMENILYKPLKTLGVMLLGGFEPEHAYIVHFFAISIGHFNHANLKWSWGPLKYVLNNPVMHLYHHAYELPKGRFGVNFGISLSLWDYLFKTHHVPEASGNIRLGFPKDEEIPDNFFGQFLHGFKSKMRK
jgi:sterol desaturase/sphingolipid hydroxylase (fatty acid hydroxylase superfamily)